MTSLNERHKFFSAALVFLIKGGQILLMRRLNTGFEDGNYSLPSGFVDAGETASQAAAREAKEETGVNIQAKNLIFAHAMFRKGAGGVWADYFFECQVWTGQPRIMEAKKCDHMHWFSLNSLPDNLAPFARQAIECYKNKIYYSEFGW